jgi:hypothetical protein
MTPAFSNIPLGVRIVVNSTPHFDYDQALHSPTNHVTEFLPA